MSSNAPAHPFRVIEGGLGKAPETPVTALGATPGSVEEERLRAAVLRLPIEDLGLTVEQCLDEMCERIDSPADADVVRYHLLRDAIAAIGLRYVVARPEFELARPGFLALSWPDRLVRRHPELAVFRPELHQVMSIG